MCDYWNGSQKKKCTKCGIKKSFANALQGSQKGSTSVAASSNGWTEPSMEVDDQPNPTNRASLVNRIKDIDAALSGIPEKDDFMVARRQLLEQKEHVKRQIIETKPMGARLDSCRAAVERAQKRSQSAAATLEAAQASLTEARQHLMNKEEELKHLEAECVTAAASDMGGGGTCLDELQNSMTKVLQEMEGSGRVQQAHATEAYANMIKLFTGLTEIARQANSGDAMPAKTAPSILEQLGATPALATGVMEQPQNAALPPGAPSATAGTPAAHTIPVSKNWAGGSPNGGA